MRAMLSLELALIRHTGSSTSYISDIILYIKSHQLYLSYEKYIHSLSLVPTGTFFEIHNLSITNTNTRVTVILVLIEHAHIIRIK